MQFKKRTFRLPIQLDDNLLSEANAKEINISEHIRQKLGEHAKSELTEILHLLKKISNNVNQTAKALNIANLTGRIEPRRYEMAFASTHNLQKLFHQVISEFAEIKRVN